MRARIFLFLVLGIISSASGQNTIDLTFTAVDNAAYIRLDSIKVMNRTQGDSVKLLWPDTTLTFQTTPGDLLLFIGYALDYPAGTWSLGKKEKKLKLYQSYPNPVRDQAVISVYLPSKGLVNFSISDIRGRVALNFYREFKEGMHSFIFHPGEETIYFLTARWNGITQSIKILTEGQAGGKTCKLEYIGLDHENPSLKQSHLKAGLVVHESGILNVPVTKVTYTFQFATNIPCPGMPTVKHEGQVYNTIQIYSQCWLKENLNVGSMIPGNQNQSNNGLTEKYCYNNEPDSCNKYGGLYQWNEMMNYTSQQGTQGICPVGWHLPTDEEWKVLEGAVDSNYGIGDPEWDISWVYRGFNAGANLKTTTSLYPNGNGADLFGFSGLPSGYRYGTGSFSEFGYIGKWWTSTGLDGFVAWHRNLVSLGPEVRRDVDGVMNSGFSVRCLKDY